MNEFLLPINLTHRLDFWVQYDIDFYNDTKFNPPSSLRSVPYFADLEAVDGVLTPTLFSAMILNS